MSHPPEGYNGDQTLSESVHFEIKASWEVVTLVPRDQPERTTKVGDFYGNPTCAVIGPTERWVFSAGCGFILYWLRPPWHSYAYDQPGEQWYEAHRTPGDIWWIDSAVAVDDNSVRFTVMATEPHAGTYLLSSDSQDAHPVA